MPLHLLRAGPGPAALLAVVALAAAAVEVPGRIGDGVDALRNGKPERAERELAPAQGLDIPDEMLLRVRQVIPEGDSYAIVFGDSIPLSDAQLTGIPQFLRYWLTPREVVGDPKAADWVIAYGHSSETLGIPIVREVSLAEAINAVRVGRGR